MALLFYRAIARDKLTDPEGETGDRDVPADRSAKDDAGQIKVFDDAIAIPLDVDGVQRRQTLGDTMARDNGLNGRISKYLASIKARRLH